MTEVPLFLRNRLDALTPESYPSGHRLIAPDRDNAAVFYLRSGLARLYSLDTSGAEHNHGFHGPGEWVYGRLSLREQQLCCSESAIGVEVLQTTVAIRVPLADLDRWRHEDRSVADYLMSQLMAMNAHRLGREAGLIQFSAEHRYRELLHKQPDLLTTVRLHQIANWLGITPIALSRIRRRVHRGAS